VGPRATEREGVRWWWGEIMRWIWVGGIVAVEYVDDGMGWRGVGGQDIGMKIEAFARTEV